MTAVPLPRVLSIDLACADWLSIGAAIVSPGEARVLPVPGRGRPTVSAVLAWIRAVAADHAVTGICIDGPLGWRAPTGRAPHCRESEAAVRAPGKTGLPPDGVKPRSYLGFTCFSIALFEALTLTDGWQLPGAAGRPLVPSSPGGSTDRQHFVTECFPTAIWRGLGVAPLAAKARCRPEDVAQARDRLEGASGVRVQEPDRLSHDQLQAVVGGIAGVRWALGDPSALLKGAPPMRLDDSWREGYILTLGGSPAASPVSLPSTAAHVSVLPS